MLINLTIFQLFTGFYDTTTGPKTDSSSYTKIAEDIEAQPDEILFLTDNPDGNFLFLIDVHDRALQFIPAPTSPWLVREKNTTCYLP